MAKTQASENENLYQQKQSIANKEYMQKAYAKLNHLLSMEELFWKQKSGVKCLVECEKENAAKKSKEPYF